MLTISIDLDNLNSTSLHVQINPGNLPSHLLIMSVTNCLSLPSGKTSNIQCLNQLKNWNACKSSQHKAIA
jgi:hypothetical protein